MKRRDLFKGLAGTLIALVVKPLAGLAGKKKPVLDNPYLPEDWVRKMDETPKSNYLGAWEPERGLGWIEDEFPGVKVLDIAGQQVFPCYAVNGAPSCRQMIVLHVGDLGEFQRLERPPFLGHRGYAWHIFNHGSGVYASFEYIPSVEWGYPADSSSPIARALRTAAKDLIAAKDIPASAWMQRGTSTVPMSDEDFAKLKGRFTPGPQWTPLDKF